MHKVEYFVFGVSITKLMYRVIDMNRKVDGAVQNDVPGLAKRNREHKWTQD